ncbi:hypothetical protein BJ742DRAFT_830565 [Cladochytrium replicatum]|nr:hypothetical protein BJ742DRAFT_830565 [Cladochytrium replicatum]
MATHRLRTQRVIRNTAINNLPPPLSCSSNQKIMSSSTNSFMAKVSFKNILRQVQVSADATPDQLWSKFVEDLSRVHGIPNNASFYLTYNDEDGDLITLDTGIELAELVRQGSGRTLRFDLVLRDPIPGSSENIGEVIERTAEPTTTEHVAAPTATDDPTNAPQASTTEAPTAPETVADPPEPELDSKDSKPDASSSSSGSSSSSRPTVDPNDPLRPLIESIQPILASLANDPALLRSLLSNLGGSAAMFIQPFIERLQESIRQYNATGGSSSSPFGSGFRGGPQHHPWGGFAGHPFAAAFGQGGGNPWAEVFRQAQEQFYQGQQGGEDRSRLREEEIREKMETLQGLGLAWESSDRVKELLRRYDGNVDRVAEVLLREQE